MKTLVIGAGKSGVAAANFLAARGDEVLLTDSNENPNLPYPLHENVARAFGAQDASLFEVPAGFKKVESERLRHK